MGDVDELIRTERLALIELLETLTPGEWATPSLCSAWTVQEVAAHLAWAPKPAPGQMLAALLRSGLRLNLASARLSIELARRGPAAILAQLRANAADGAKPLGVPMSAVLVDAVVHAIDIRNPLDRPRAIPAEAFRQTADASIGLGWPMNVSVGGSARKRLAGVRLVAPDYSWAYGTGEEVRATGEAVLRLLNGRPVDRAELSGPGADRLADRLANSG